MTVMTSRLMDTEGELRKPTVHRHLRTMMRDQQWEDNGWDLKRQRDDEHGDPFEMVYLLKASYFYKIQSGIARRFADFKRSVESRYPELVVEMSEEPERTLESYKDPRVHDEFRAWPKQSYLTVVVVVRNRQQAGARER